jgi:uncharacterized protein YqjF (DUF2071 family)
LKIQEILNTIGHRPWKLPSEKWKYYQEWNNVIFLHWSIDPEIVREYVPKEIEIDLYNNEAWISMLAFSMENVRLRNLPSMPCIFDFYELNIRTYVKYKNKTGVYFLSIEASSKLACFLARSLSELPYRYSSMKRSDDCFESTHSDLKDNFKLIYQSGENLNEKNDFDIWLTERYALFQDGKNGINAFEIHHVEWPLSKVKIDALKIDYPRFNGLLHEAPVLSHYSKGVQIIAWDR